MGTGELSGQPDKKITWVSTSSDTRSRFMLWKPEIIADLWGYTRIRRRRQKIPLSFDSTKYIFPGYFEVDTRLRRYGDMWVHSREESLSFHSKYILNQEYSYFHIHILDCVSAFRRTCSLSIQTPSKHILSGGVVLQLGPCQSRPQSPSLKKAAKVWGREWAHACIHICARHFPYFTTEIIFVIPRKVLLALVRKNVL